MSRRCLALFGAVRRCSALFGAVWRQLAPEHLLLVLKRFLVRIRFQPSPTAPCCVVQPYSASPHVSALFGAVWRSSALFGALWRCLAPVSARTSSARSEAFSCGNTLSAITNSTKLRSQPLIPESSCLGAVLRSSALFGAV